VKQTFENCFYSSPPLGKCCHISKSGTPRGKCNCAVCEFYDPVTGAEIRRFV
jgi:hypothetical protein